jgi:hypothetical protein
MLPPFTLCAVAVETVTFDDAEDDDLPAPLPAPVGAIAAVSAVRRRPQPAAPPAAADDEDMDTSESAPPLPAAPTTFLPPPPDHAAAPFRVVLDYTPTLPTALPGASGDWARRVCVRMCVCECVCVGGGCTVLMSFLPTH